MFQDDELVQEFVVESSAHLADVEGQLLEIEAAGNDYDTELVNTVFRAVHSVKGAAGFLGLSVINTLAHNLENVLNMIRNRELSLDKAIVNTLLRSADQLKMLVDDVEQSNNVDVSDLVAELEAIATGTFVGGSPDSEGAGELDENLDASTGYDTDSQEFNADATEGTFALQSPVSSGDDSETLAGIENDLSQMGETISSLQWEPQSSQSDDQVEPGSGQAYDLVDGIEAVSETNEHDEPAEPQYARKPIGAPSPSNNRPKPEKAMEKTKPSPIAVDKTNSAASPKPKATDSIVRVNVAVLDRLMNLAGELVLSRNQLIAAVSNGAREGLETIASRVDQVTSELQETIMQTRMQPIGTVFGRFPRVVRDLSNKLGKECVLEIEGDEVEVDKTIVEAMGDPLTHLVRNSVDHGIETPNRRAEAGKTSTGRIRLRAFHQAGKVCIRIEDDGAGMDPVKLRTKAIEKGIVSAEQAAMMSDNEALRLIFAPGFSTAAQVTDVSGRGVGMDVVKTNIEHLGGTVDIESNLGQGSAVHITLPLTLAIVPSMIVGCAGERYAVPQANIVELVRVPEAEMSQKIGTIHGAEVLRLRGALLPLVRLDNALGLRAVDQASERPKNANILVLETGQMRYGLLVDSLHDNEEIVVKPLGKHLRDLGYLAGATILGDGYVALILDIVGIAMQCNLRNIEAKTQDGENSSLANSEVHRMLLFSNHSTEQFAVPMPMVARIERIKASDIKSVGSQNILIYRGHSLPILRLEENIAALPSEQSNENVFIIVFRVHDREVGLVAPTLRDIRDVPMAIDAKTLREPGVLGAIIVDSATTRVLDLIELVRMKYQEWFLEEFTTQSEEVEQPPTVLLAEDSDFFRNHVTRTLENEGFKVVSAVDGQDAWDHLQAIFNDIDVIVTDIEMPRMNGLEFAKAVRSRETTARLPIIALTSLAGDEDKERGASVGINEYQIKMDPARLVDAVRRLAGTTV